MESIQKKRMSPNYSAIFVMLAAVVLLVATLLFKNPRNGVMEIVRAGLYALSVALAGHEIAIGGIEKLFSKKISEQLLFTVVILALFLTRHYQEAALVTLVYSLGQILIDTVKDMINDRLRKLTNATVPSALKEDGEALHTVSAADLKQGDIIVIETGETVPVTGETLATEGKESRVIDKGTVNDGASLRLRVTQTYCIPRYETQTEEPALRSKFESALRLAAKIYIPIVVVIAVVLTIVTIVKFGHYANWTLYYGLIILAMASPVPMLLALPAHIESGKALIRQAGIRAMGSASLEKVAKMKTLVLDKTGVVTVGQYSVGEITAINGYSEKQVLDIAAIAEAHSEHPIAAALREAAGHPNAGEVQTVELPSNGVLFDHNGKQVRCGSARFMKANGIDISELPDVAVYVAIGDMAIGAIKMLDTLRSEAPKTIAALEAYNIHSVLVTGDNATTTSLVAKKSGIKESYAQLTPSEKEAKVKEYAKKGTTGFFGNCISDESVMNAAEVGFVFGDETVEATPKRIVIEKGGLISLPYLVQKAQKMMSGLYIGAGIAIAAKIAVIVMALLKSITMWMAVAIDVLASLLSLLLVNAALGEAKGSEQKGA